MMPRLLKAPGLALWGQSITLALALFLAIALVASASVALTQISSDTYTTTPGQHKTQVEPDTFSFGNTIVMATQTGRFIDGGSSNIAWATSTNGGSSWSGGNLPGITKADNPSNPYDRVSDASVAYDAKHGVWMISTLALVESSNGPPSGAAVLTSRSTDGGVTWGNPVVVSNVGDVDKNWIVCDNTASSPFYGNCYTEWDVFSENDRIYMSTSTDGGATWGPRTRPRGNPTGLGGQPVVQPDGTVIVPIANAFETAIGAFTSNDGGKSWSHIMTVSRVADHTVAGNLRSGALPSAEIDGAGTVYVVWQDCRFRTGCPANDIVMSTSSDGRRWTSPVRIPIDATTSTVDHFIPGLAVDKSTSGSGAHLVLTYYFYPTANCTLQTCALHVGSISSINGGASWSSPVDIAGPMTLTWLPDTSQGRMVGDYISTSFNAAGTAHAAFAVASAPTGGGSDCATATPNCNQATFTTTSGQAALGGNVAVTEADRQEVPNAASDHPAPQSTWHRR